MSEDTAYQCKLCSDRFKTTADLQKHKRLSHRNGVNLAITTGGDVNGNVKIKSEPAPVSSSAKNQDVGLNVEKVQTTGHGHRTRYAGMRNSNDCNDDILLKGGRRLTCASCGHNFDTKDSVVLHLLRHSRNGNGTHKCPFCGKALIKPGSVLSVSIDHHEVEAGVESRDNRLTRSATQKRQSSASNINSKNSANQRTPKNSHRNVKSQVGPTISQVLPIPTVQPPSSTKNKRKISPPPAEHVPSKNAKLSTSIVGHNKSLSDRPFATRTPPTPVLGTPPVLSSSSTTSLTSTESPLSGASTPINSVRAFQSDQIKRDYELTYKRPRSRGSQGGGSVGRRASGSSSNSATDNSKNDVDPLKVSVLINNSPYPSATRLAVPKGKHFRKGDIRCPYCGFEAQSVREVQFHVNTHMAKSYPCEFCSHIYRSKQAVLKHTEKYHSVEVMKRQAISQSVETERGQGIELESNLEYDQRSMSNYSSSMASDGAEIENYFSELSQSQDLNLENNANNYAIAPTNISYYAPEIQHGSYFNEQSSFLSNFGNSLIGQYESHVLRILEEGVDATERVVEISNF